MRETMDLIFEKSRKGRRGLKLPAPDVDVTAEVPPGYRREIPLPWPEVTELECVRHFTALSQRNYSVDTHFYPLGSCTMKYNPRFTEEVAALEGFSGLHPLLPQFRRGGRYAQGALKVLHDLEALLCEITGMSAFTLQPLAGAHGELTGVMMMAAYHKARGNKKKYIIVPDSAHGTNPASAAIAGYGIVSVPTNARGVMDLAVLKEKLTSEAAGLMITCPNTLGIFNAEISQVAELVHAVDGIMYYDGANLNALLGRCRPGDLGFDVMHLNLHKTFATPHGGGGPGAGPVGVTRKLEPYLPISRVVRNPDGDYALRYDYPESIGYVASFYGNFAVIVKALAYILLLGGEGLKEVSDHAVLNANYLLSRLKGVLDLPFDRTCMHECVFSAGNLLKDGVHAIDVAKYLIDEGIHPPTVYFPLIVKEAMMIEPTETESLETMDRFVEAVKRACADARKAPERLRSAPRTTPISRPDEGLAARQLNANYFSA